MTKTTKKEVQERRINWLKKYLEHNDQSRFREQIGITEANLDKLLAGRRTFTDSLASFLETKLGMQPGAAG
jgi:plasmid maintenance system antidote protein VapI